MPAYQSSLSSHEIRLLRLPEATPTYEALSCELEIFEDVDCPPFVALSYAWGTDASVGLLKINHQPWEISETVEDALRELCLRSYRHVWVDQICINQSDDEEKTHQVLKMRYIYSSADSVVAWLGSAFKNSNKLFVHLEKLGHGFLEEDWKGLDALHEDEAYLADMSEAFNLLCLREYWTRLWILQEFAMASNLTIMSENSAISYEILLAAYESLTEVAERNREQPTEITTRLAERITSMFSSPALSFFESVVNRRFKYRDESREGDHFFRVITSCLALEMDYNYPMASDPRDRVFALVYLCTDSHQLAELIDYSRSCQEVYHDLALALIKQGHIDVLSYCQFPKSLSNLPSWVPDWNMPIRGPCNQPPWFTTFFASGNTADKQVIDEISPGLLRVRGVAIDTIVKRGKVWDPDWYEQLSRAAVLSFVDDIYELCIQSPRVRVGEERLDACRIAATDGVQYNMDISGDSIVGHIEKFLAEYNRLTSSPGQEEAETSADEDSCMPKDLELTLWLWVEGMFPRRIDYLMLLKGISSSAEDLNVGKTNDPNLKIIRMTIDLKGMAETGSMWKCSPPDDPVPAGCSTPALRVTDKKTGVSRLIRESASIAAYLDGHYADFGPALQPTDPIDVAVMSDLIGMVQLAGADCSYYLRHACSPVASLYLLKDENRSRESALNGKACMIKGLKKIQLWAQDSLKTTGWLTPGTQGPGLVDLNLASGRRYMELGYEIDMFEDEELKDLAQWYERFKQLPWWNAFEEREGGIHPEEIRFAKLREV
ncbi:Heterokaryon incompatibility protein [Paramyrothecium foliicola]|nr:Heterokaryon incompatibility protein [Paramyrothecium foliicola]